MYGGFDSHLGTKCYKSQVSIGKESFKSEDYRFSFNRSLHQTRLYVVLRHVENKISFVDCALYIYLNLKMKTVVFLRN